MPQTDIRGLKDLIHIPYPVYYYVVGGLLAIGVVALVVWLVRNFSHKTAAPPAAVPPEPLDKRILKELAKLRDGYGDGSVSEKRFHFLLSEIFRRYLEDRFDFAATDSTTEEILARLPQLVVSPEPQRDSLVRILQETDEVKFAERHKSQAEARDLLGLAEHFVRETAVREASDT